jgi:hypothetical protein
MESYGPTGGRRLSFDGGDTPTHQTDTLIDTLQRPMESLLHAYCASATSERDSWRQLFLKRAFKNLAKPRADIAA